MERKLASVQTVTEVNPIPGADKIEVASVLGYKVVVQKGKVKPGDTVVYIEVDAVVPDIPVFDFLRKYKFRVKANRLRGQISSGLVMTLEECGLDLDYNIGDDLTSDLHITRYIEPVPLHLDGKVIGIRPPFVPKTDEFRLQSYPNLLEELGNQPAYISIKIDGTSSSVYYNPILDEPFGVCSRNLNLARDENNGHWKVAMKHDLEAKMRDLQLTYQFKGGFVIQGELAGPGIQKNRMELKEIDIYVFQIFDIERYRYLSVFDMETTCHELGLNSVDIIEYGVYEGLTVDDWIERSKRLYEGTKNHCEGIVVRTEVPIRTETLEGKWLGFKIINPDYLVNY